MRAIILIRFYFSFSAGMTHLGTSLRPIEQTGYALVVVIGEILWKYTKQQNGYAERCEWKRSNRERILLHSLHTLITMTTEDAPTIRTIRASKGKRGFIVAAGATAANRSKCSPKTHKNTHTHGRRTIRTPPRPRGISDPESC